MEFRDPEWKTLGLRVQNRLAAEPAPVIGAQGQMEQVFLNLLVHAEQCAADAPGKTISAASTNYRRTCADRNQLLDSGAARISNDPDAGALGLGVWQGIIHSHGGEIRFPLAIGLGSI